MDFLTTEKQFFVSYPFQHQQPKLIQQMKRQKLKQKLAQPHWEQIEQIISNIVENTFIEQQANGKDILCYRDLCENDITYHLIVNQRFDLFLNLLESSKPLYTQELNQIIQSLIKGVIKIKNKQNYPMIIKFLKQLHNLLKTEEGSDQQKGFQFQFDIVIYSRFDYTNLLWEVNLLLKIYKLLGNNYSLNELKKLLQVKQQIEFNEFIISKKVTRRKLQHLEYFSLGYKYEGYHIYDQICDHGRWDKIINICDEEIFTIFQDGFSPYMKMLQKAPFEFLVDYHNKHIHQIQSHIQTQKKKHGYNMLHCVAENRNSICPKFIDILKELNLDEFKFEAYFDQIPLVYYIDKQKTFDQSFLFFLSNGLENKSIAEFEGLQIIGQLHAKMIYENQKKEKPTYIRKYKYVNGLNKNKNKKVKSLYKQITKPINLDCPELVSIYQQIVQMHKIYNLRGLQQHFEISQYSFSNFELNHQIFNVEQPIMIWTKDTNILKKFLSYMEDQFGQNISQNQLEIIESIQTKLKSNLSLEQLLLQRKIIILNALFKQYKGESNIQDLIKLSISSILGKYGDPLTFSFCSYSQEQTFQDFLLCNDLINIDEYQVGVPEETFPKLYNLGYRNEKNMIQIASLIPEQKNGIKLSDLLTIHFPQKLRTGGCLEYFIMDLFWNQQFCQKLQTCAAGINYLFQEHSKERFFRIEMKKILLQYNHDSYVPFFETLYNQFDKKQIWNLTMTPAYRFILCHIEQSQLKHLFYYQLKGINVKFNLNQRRINFEASSIQEEVIIKQIKEKKTFFQVLASNDNYIEFTKEYLKIYQKQESKEEKVDYVIEALYNEAYQTLELLKDYIQENLEYYIGQREYKLILFSFLKKVGPTYFGFSIKQRGKKRKIYPLEYDNLAKYVQVDSDKLNRQIQAFYKLFADQIQHLEKNEASFFVQADKQEFVLKQLLYYLNLDSIVLLKKQVIQYIQSAPNRTLFNFYKFISKEEVFLYVFQLPEKKLSVHCVTPFIFTELSVKMFEAIFAKEYDYPDGIKDWKNLSYVYLCKKYLNEINLYPPMIVDKMIFDYQFNELVRYFINNNEQRKVEFLLLFSSLFKIKEQIIPPKSKYYLAFLHGPELGLNVQLFNDLIKNNQIDKEKKSKILINLVGNGQYQKVQLTLEWIENEQELFYYTNTAVSMILEKQIVQNRKTIDYNTFLMVAPEYHVYSTLSHLASETQSSNINECKVNKSCLFQSNDFQTDRYKTASILYEKLISKVSDYRIFSQNNQQIQLIFPNTKYLVEDQEAQLLKCIIFLVTNNLFYENWPKYLELIEQNIQYYDDSLIDLTFIFEIKIESRSGNFYKKMIDIFIKASKLNKILNQDNVQGSDKYLYRRSQDEYNCTRFDQKIKKNRFADILKKHFNGVTFELIEQTKRHRQIYYGQPFENESFNEQDLFIALMSRRKESILKILSQAQDIQQILTEYQIIQYLIIHGGEQTVIQTLELVNQINLEWFYYKGIPLLTYIVFKKWYKLYAFAEQYLFEQWIAKPNLLNQIKNNDQIELTIHQFATLNQFYVQNRIPLEKQLLSRTCSFLIPNSHNQSLPNYKIYVLLKELFPQVSAKKLEIFSLQHQQTENHELDPIELCFQKHSSDLHILKRLLAIYSNNENNEQKQLKRLFDLLGIQCDTVLNNFTVQQLKNLFELIYNTYGLYHPLIHQIIQVLPKDFIDIRLFDNPTIAVYIAQYGEFQIIKQFLEQQDLHQSNLKQISIHIMKIILMIKYGQNYENLFDNQIDIHLKYYVDAYQLIDQDQNGNITNQFIEQSIKILNLSNATIQTIDYFLNQILDEKNQIKKALKLIIKLKEFNYYIQSLENQAIAKVDYLVKKFSFEVANEFGLKRLGEESTIQIPLSYQIDDLESFLNSLPSFYKPEYEEAIIKRTTTKKRKIKIPLNIKFEEKNLSSLYNDLRFWISELRAQPESDDVLDNKSYDGIQGWQGLLNSMDNDNAFIYTLMPQDQHFFVQLFYQIPGQLEYKNKYPKNNLVFFNNKSLFNQGYVQDLIDQALFEEEIDLISFVECFFKRFSLVEQYGSWKQYCLALTFYNTFQDIIKYVFNMIESIVDFFDLEKQDDYIIKFEQSEFEGTSPKTCFLDEYFTFGKGQLSYESKKLVFVLPVSYKSAKQADNQYLNNIFSEKDLNNFIQNQFGLDDEIDALMYRLKLQQKLNETCQTFRKNTNLDLAIEFNKSEIKQQIESLPYLEQVDYLGLLLVYFENTVYVDLNNFIQSNRFSQLYKENLCSGQILQKPLKIGYLYNNIPKSLCNHFGFLQTRTQFLKTVKKGQIYHICYISGNKYLVDLCKFVKFHRQKCYVKFISKKSKKKAISVSKIQSAILYFHQIDPINNQEDRKYVELLFIDNSGLYYFNRDESFLNKIDRVSSLPECIKVTRREFKLILNKENVSQNDFYFNTTDFRFKDIYETSFLKDKDYMLDSLKKQRELIKVVPALSEHVGFEKINKSKEVNSFKNRQLLLILSQIDVKQPQKEFEIPLPGEILTNKNQEAFLQYCKSLTTEKKDFSKAGVQRQDKVKFFDCTNSPITKPVEEINLKCYIQHEKFTEIVYWPTIEFEKDYYKFIWTPKIKGLYQLFINGERTYFKFLVVSSSPVAENYKLENFGSVPFFYETELKFTLFDEFQNLITKLDKSEFQFKVNSKTPNVTINSRYECKNNYVALYFELCNSFKQDDSEEECELEIQLQQTTLIKSLKIIAKPRELTQQRIQAFTQKIPYQKTVQLLVQRNNFLPSLMQLKNKKGPQKFKINFFNELANDQGGPSREFFTILGEYLKSQEYKLFRRTPIKNNYFIWIGFFQENGLDLAYAIGLLIAYALANRFQIGISFALPFWKILIDLPLGFSDLKFIIDQQSFQSYEYLQGLSNEELQQLNLTFINPSDGKNICINGDSIVVDKNNLNEYLYKSAMYQIYYEYEKIFIRMKEGFNGQYNPKILQECFSLPELNKLIDQSDYQIDNLFILTKIKYSRRGELVKDYVEMYIKQLDQNGLKKLIQFVTGSPYFYVHEFKIEIQVDVTASKSKLPMSRTCSNVLVIPNYQNYEVLKLKMNQALEWGTDFFGQN